MTKKTCYFALILLASAAMAGAADFGGHVGYFGTDVKKADVGVNMMLPIGMIVLAPNIDYTKTGNAGLWFGNADVALRFGAPKGTSYWVGAGPTYGYVSNYSNSSTGVYGRPAVRGQQYTPPTTPPGGNPPSTGTVPGAHTAFDRFGGATSAWGWDANAGVSFGTSSLRPYVVGRYDQVHNLKTAGVALGLRFGH
ncbi:MAG TPA: hypothetical protein VF975_08590 [Thermoanaerobaculia bacterium]